VTGGQLSQALHMIVTADPYIVTLVWATVRVALISTGAALVLGLPLALGLGLGDFRGRRVLHALANASMALPPVVVGVVVLLVTIPQSALAGLHLSFSMTGVYVVQAILALPYVVALGAAAIQALAPGLLSQARMLGAGRRQLALLALSEARVGIAAATIAALGAVVSEIGAVVIVGGNIDGSDQTLASALLAQFNFYTNNGVALAIAIVLCALILILAGALTVIQQRTHAIRFRLGTG
jgi:tungstate transport system permease protein